MVDVRESSTCQGLGCVLYTWGFVLLGAMGNNDGIASFIACSRVHCRFFFFFFSFFPFLSFHSLYILSEVAFEFSMSLTPCVCMWLACRV